MTGSRHRARIIALQALYEIDTVGHDTETTLAHCLPDGISEDTARFARKLVAGVLQHRQEIDSSIQRFAPAYPVEQLSPIDRNTLRLAISEILFSNGVPVKAVINEAVELAKAFGSEASPRFINGVLGTIVSAEVPARAAAVTRAQHKSKRKGGDALATVYDRLKKVIVDRLDVDEAKVVPEARFAEDLEADSLDLVEMIMAIEEEFSSSNGKMEIPDEDAEKIKTVQDAIDYVYSRGIGDS